ncbi:MAG: hypothetical protein L6R40_004332 [Gallowayella cf. fulva]|nr:MAG: hypothetical protein L6R40_004332 [Xanthomendoza cf. fulva]
MDCFLALPRVPGYYHGTAPTDDHPFLAVVPQIKQGIEWNQIRQAWLFHEFSPASATKFMAIALEIRKQLFHFQETYSHQHRGLADSKAYHSLLQREEGELLAISPDDTVAHEEILRRIEKNRKLHVRLEEQVKVTMIHGQRLSIQYERLKAKAERIIRAYRQGVRLTAEGNPTIESGFKDDGPENINGNRHGQLSAMSHQPGRKDPAKGVMGYMPSPPSTASS